MASLHLTIVIIIVLFAILGYIRPVWAVYVSVFFVPWQELMVDLGLRITMFTLSLVGLISAIATQTKKIIPVILNDHPLKPLFVLLAWALIVTLSQLNLTAEIQVSGGPMRSPLVRPIVQIFSFAMMFIPLLTVPHILSRREHLIGLAKSFFISISILLLIGWWQLIIAAYTGSNPLPMGIINSWLGGLGHGVRDAIDLGYDRKYMFRMSSFGGEPRWLGQSIATALLLMQIFTAKRLISFNWSTTGLYIFFIISLIATQSLSGFYLWFLGSTVLIIYYFWQNLYKSRNYFFSQQSQLLSVLLLIIFLGGIILFNSKAPPALIGSDYLWYFLQRVSRRGLIDDFDVPVLEFLRNEPWHAVTGVGMGNIHLFADTYLLDYFRSFAGGTSFAAESGWLRLLSELGLVGLCLFLWWGWRCFFAALSFKNRSQQSVNSSIWAPICLIAFVGYLARGISYSPIAFFLLASFFVAIQVEKNQKLPS